MSPYLLIGIFILTSILGYIIIKNIPSLLHTPLMSGMNALSGVTLLGALLITARLYKTHVMLSIIIGGVVIILAMINVVGGFLVTDRMLRKFKTTVKK